MEEDVVEGDAREEWDRRLAGEHGYLEQELGGSSVYPREAAAAEPGSETAVLLVLVSSVVVPGERVPLTFSDSQELADALRQPGPLRPLGLVQSRLQGAGPEQDGSCSAAVGVLAPVVRLAESRDEFALVCLARQRVRLRQPLQLHQVLYSADYRLAFAKDVRVQVQRDHSLGPLCREPHSAVFRVPSATVRTDYLRSLCGLSPEVVVLNETSRNVRRLLGWFLRWYDQERLDREVAEGLAAFSFWAAAALPCTPEQKLQFLAEDCVDVRLALEERLAQSVTRLVCKECGDLKADLADIVNMVASGMSSNFVNPHGHVHDMFTTRSLAGHRLQGRPSTQYSWFPGYAWTIAVCSACGEHLGWRFTSSTKSPAAFYGLVRSAISAAAEPAPTSSA